MSEQKEKGPLVGSARRKAKGIRVALIEFTSEEFAALERACEIEKRSKANFIGRVTMSEVWRLIQQDDLIRLRHLDRRNAQRIESDANGQQ